MVLGSVQANPSRRRNHRLSRQLGQEVVGQPALPAACTCPGSRGCGTLTATTVARLSFPWALPTYLPIYLPTNLSTHLSTYLYTHLQLPGFFRCGTLRAITATGQKGGKGATPYK